MFRRIWLSVGISMVFCHISYSEWLEISNAKIRQDETELGGAKIVIEYDIKNPKISPEAPAYVFIRYSKGHGDNWQLVPVSSLGGNGFDIVEKPGHKKVVWWGTSETSFFDLTRVQIRVRGIQMVRIPRGERHEHVSTALDRGRGFSDLGCSAGGIRGAIRRFAARRRESGVGSGKGVSRKHSHA